MKSIKNFLFEAFKLNSITKGNNPDTIKHNKLSLYWSSKYARAFIYNTKNDKFLLSCVGETHSDIIEYEEKGILRDFGLNPKTSLEELRFFSYNDEDISDKEEWKKEHKNNDKKFKLGRIWVIPKENFDKELKYDVVYIAWWNELTSSEFNKYNKKVLDYLSTVYGRNLERCIFIDNNGVTKPYDKNESNVRVKKASASRKKEMEIARNIHLASQKEKEKFYKEFKRNRDEENQKKYYNHTKSKTEAEYRSIKYQENKNMKSLKNYLTEMAHVRKEMRKRPVMTPWGEYTGEEEEYEEYIVDKCDQEDWADFLQGKDELGDNLKKLKFVKIGNEKHWDYSFGDSEKEWKDKEFTSMTIRWKDTSSDRGTDWNEEMYVKEKHWGHLAEKFFKDLEAYRTEKMSKEDFLSKWKVTYNKGKGNGMPSLDFKVNDKEFNNPFTVHMNALLS